MSMESIRASGYIEPDLLRVPLVISAENKAVIYKFHAQIKTGDEVAELLARKVDAGTLGVEFKVIVRPDSMTVQVENGIVRTYSIEGEGAGSSKCEVSQLIADDIKTDQLANPANALVDDAHSLSAHTADGSEFGEAIPILHSAEPLVPPVTPSSPDTAPASGSVPLSAELVEFVGLQLGDIELEYQDVRWSASRRQAQNFMDLCEEFLRPLGKARVLPHGQDEPIVDAGNRSAEPFQHAMLLADKLLDEVLFRQSKASDDIDQFRELQELEVQIYERARQYIGDLWVGYEGRNEVFNQRFPRYSKPPQDFTYGQILKYAYLEFHLALRKGQAEEALPAYPKLRAWLSKYVDWFFNVDACPQALYTVVRRLAAKVWGGQETQRAYKQFLKSHLLPLARTKIVQLRFSRKPSSLNPCNITDLSHWLASSMTPIEIVCAAHVASGRINRADEYLREACYLYNGMYRCSTTTKNVQTLTYELTSKFLQFYKQDYDSPPSILCGENPVYFRPGNKYDLQKDLPLLSLNEELQTDLWKVGWQI